MRRRVGKEHSTVPGLAQNWLSVRSSFPGTFQIILTTIAQPTVPRWQAGLSTPSYCLILLGHAASQSLSPGAPGGPAAPKLPPATKGRVRGKWRKGRSFQDQGKNTQRPMLLILTNMLTRPSRHYSQRNGCFPSCVD